MNKSIENVLDYADFNKFMSKFTEIYDGKSSLTKDISDPSKLYRIFILAITSGFSLLMFNLAVFSYIFYYFKFDITIQLILLAVLTFYIFQDMLKLDFYEKDDDDSNDSEFMKDMLEKYTITNAIGRLPFNRLLSYTLFFLVRIVAPVATINVPKIYCNVFLYYRYPGLTDLIEGLLKKEEGVGFEPFEDHKGFTIKQVLENNEPEHITSTLNKTPKQNFPYIYDPEYYNKNSEAHKYQKKFCVLKVIKKAKDKKKTVGYLFVHLFKGVKINRIGAKNPPEKSYRTKEHGTEPLITTYYEPEYILYLILIGERNSMTGLETLLKMNANSVPVETLNIDIEK
ncbi:MAG: hypothetical protein IMZ60_02430 [Actinobacteria bacterium]|nr:hypothetical protein [Actinomycetota bacterium]